MIFADTPHFYNFILGTVLIKLSEITLLHFTNLIAGIFRIDFTFISKVLICSSSACVRTCNMHENMKFVIGKLYFVSYQFYFRCSPPLTPKKPFGLQNVAIYIHNICKGHLGL